MLYVIHAVENARWFLIVESIVGALFSLFYLSTAIDLLVKRKNQSTYVAAMIGFAAVVVYAIESFVKIRRWKRGKLPQGAKIVEHAQPLSVLT